MPLCIISRVGSSSVTARMILGTPTIAPNELFMETHNPDRSQFVSRKKTPEAFVRVNGVNIPRGEWAARPPTDEEAKLTGISIFGVMCSLTWKDQFGLASIKEYVKAGISIRFEFENGNKLTLTQANIAEFESFWLPARLAFFPLEE